MNEKIIKFVTINLGGEDDEDVTIDVEKAKKLYEALKELFDQKVIVTTYPTYPWKWVYPEITWADGTSQIAYDTTNGDMNLSL